MRTIRTEVLIIGSGFGAAAPALRLSEAGVKVLMIEKGPNIIPEKDIKQTSDPKYLLKYLKSSSSQSIDMTYAEGLGGGSPFYEMVSLRAPSVAFVQEDKSGRALWGPIGRRTLDPYYDQAEKMLRVEQIGENEIPKTGVVFSYMMKRLGYSCERARFAVQGCVGSGFCISGCVFGAKQSLLVNYLPQALANGLTILTDTDARYIKPLGFAKDRETKENDLGKIPFRYEVECFDRVKNETFLVQAKSVIMGGGSFGTAALLLRSQMYLPSISDHVGKNIAFNGSTKAIGLLPDDMLEADMLTGRTHPGMISYEFLPSHGITLSAVKTLPLFASTAVRFWVDGTDDDRPADWGMAGDELMKKFRHKMIILYALGLTPPTARIKMKSENSFEPELEITDELKAYYKRNKDLMNSILTRNGCKLVHTAMIDGEGKDYDSLHFSTTHMIGSARMADSKENGVTDYNGEVFGYRGLFVSDGASVPSSLAVNSSLTILANAERIAAGLVKRYGRSILSLKVVSN